MLIVEHLKGLINKNIQNNHVIRIFSSVAVPRSILDGYSHAGSANQTGIITKCQSNSTEVKPIILTIPNRSLELVNPTSITVTIVMVRTMPSPVIIATTDDWIPPRRNSACREDEASEFSWAGEEEMVNNGFLNG